MVHSGPMESEVDEGRTNHDADSNKNFHSTGRHQTRPILENWGWSEFGMLDAKSTAGSDKLVVKVLQLLLLLLLLFQSKRSRSNFGRIALKI